MSTLTQQLKGIHPLVTAAMVSAGMENLTTFQQRVLAVLNGPAPDVIAETTARCGHLSTMAVWAAHCVLSSEAKEDRVALVVARNDGLARAVGQVLQKLSIHGLRYQVVDSHSTGPIQRGVRVVIGTPVAAHRHKELMERCCTVVTQDVNGMPLNAAVDLIEMAVKANPTVTLMLLASCPPPKVDISLRYLLRRSNRRYIHADVRPSAIFTTLLCQTNKEREELAMRVAQLPDLRRVVIMTHNREVKDLRQFISDKVKLNAFGIHRSTPNPERQRVLGDFLSSKFAVLVTMDAFTGVDLIDVDAVIHFYPPQKSMPDSEWDPFVACLKSTGDPVRPRLVATVAAPDDITMIAYLFAKLGTPNAPIINVLPSHPDFEDIVRCPEAALLLQGPDPPARLIQQQQQQKQAAAAAAAAGGSAHVPGTTVPSSTAAAAVNGAAKMPPSYTQHQKQGNPIGGKAAQQQQQKQQPQLQQQQQGKKQQQQQQQQQGKKQQPPPPQPATKHNNPPKPATQGGQGKLQQPQGKQQQQQAKGQASQQQGKKQQQQQQQQQQKNGGKQQQQQQQQGKKK